MASGVRGPDGNERCVCGSEWWVPVAEMQEVGPVGPAFVLAHDGAITGYAGRFDCAECAAPWPGPYQGLRLVKE